MGAFQQAMPNGDRTDTRRTAWCDPGPFRSRCMCRTKTPIRWFAGRLSRSGTLVGSSRMAEPAGAAGETDGERRERAVGWTARTLIDQAPVVGEVTLPVRGVAAQDVVGERERMRRKSYPSTHWRPSRLPAR